MNVFSLCYVTKESQKQSRDSFLNASSCMFVNRVNNILNSCQHIRPILNLLLLYLFEDY